MNKIVSWCFVVFWVIVLVLTFMGKMMLAMDLMAIGMLADALRCVIKK